ELRALDVPVMLMHGDADVSVPIEITGRKTAALLPQARLCELPDAGHGLYVTHARHIVEQVGQFVGIGAFE
ncbi:MAG: hypothetical protein QOC63_4411, partial [Mycobacterium sp.]|nr:hypothetical protein [Mycobacterium sp.]